ncbi:TonB-dependent receptor [Rhodothermus profundi]|uniref:Iron complex outermembrane recepter protein n=1 Tax=Rhodothermus profundi TaxID=633813 RepID=A0A1M6UTZ4_9BACT|nr:TonB-dependent receptor [Rhodothermus profundi]SHK72633.1 iron complex outermembrane recepter protein [Rhodothermus profundi]
MRSYYLIVVWLTCSLAVSARAQAVLTGQVLDAETRAPLPGAHVLVDSTTYGTITNAAGLFTLRLMAGHYSLLVRFVGYEPAHYSIALKAGDTLFVPVLLHPTRFELEGIQVTALRPDLRPTAQLQEAAVREANPRDAGELLRALPGLAAVRRGPLGLDPVIRGLRETEVGVYLDGSRLFPAGPARMDSPMSHFDPTIIQSMEVVKGPYALTWGAGNLSAIRVETRGLRTLAPGRMQGRLHAGYDTNLNAFENGLQLGYRQGTLGLLVQTAWRQGADYRAGDGSRIPAHFRSREVRLKLGYLPHPDTRLVIAAGYQAQRDLDYPGLILNADFFDAYTFSATFHRTFRRRLMRSLYVQAYYNAVDHGMDNDDKPTARPDPNRMPPFALDVQINSGIDVVGGRLALKLAPGFADELEIGADAYHTYRNATRWIRRRDTGRLLFEDLVWPRARITDVGLFTRWTHSPAPHWQVAATVRLDLVAARADTASTFFLENVATDLTAHEANLSGALTVSWLPHPRWSVAFGVGSAVRTADATERYADRLPSSKAQMSAEFVGDPTLRPERSTQADLWLETAHPGWSLSLNLFARRLDHYITIAPTNLPKRLPLSPPVVFRYVNGTATFYGGELTLALRLHPALTLTTTGSYLWGRDETRNEPAFGVAPPRVDLSLRYEPSARFFAEATWHRVARQNRVAVSRGETPTDGYATIDLKAGVRLFQSGRLQLGVQNLTDVAYADHLNAINPFTGSRILEPGRVFFLELTLAF